MPTKLRIDAHVHYTPPSLAENLTEFSQVEPYWGLLLNNPNSIQGWVTPEQMLTDMDEAGLDTVILVGEYYQTHQACVRRNDQAINLVKRWPERILALATIQPKMGDVAMDELKRCVDGGLVGVGELNPYAQGYQLDDPDFLRLVEQCIRYNLPLNLHVSEEIGPYYVGKSTTPLRHYYELACRYPELKLILAHWGGGLFFYEIMPHVRRQLQNVWYDTAASPLLYPTRKIFQLALTAIDPRKILYGSDYPLRIYPRHQKEPDFQRFIAEINALALDEAVYDDLMGQNAARLFGLSDDGDSRMPTMSNKLDSADRPALIEATMPVRMAVDLWPETIELFEKFNIPWQDTVAPAWEPIAQAAAAQGLESNAIERLLEALNQAKS